MDWKHEGTADLMIETPHSWGAWLETSINQQKVHVHGCSSEHEKTWRNYDYLIEGDASPIRV